MKNSFVALKNKKRFTYNDAESAQNYIRYVESADGKVERRAITQAVFSHLPENKEGYILDAACGTGWLTRSMAEKYAKVLGFDSSVPLLESAKKNALENCSFIEADVLKEIPTLDRPYDSTVFCLAAHDVKNPKEAYFQLEKVLKDDGKMIVVVANPYYSFPVGIWKRGILGKILGKGKTRLLLNPYNDFARGGREFHWKGSIPSYFHTLPETLNDALERGFQLEKMEEIRIDDGSHATGRKWQLHNYPMLLMLVFRKEKK